MSDFEQFRGQCLEEMEERNVRVLKRFFFCINYKGIVGYSNSLCDRIFTVYTDKPGILIGKGGSNVEILKQILNEEFNLDYTVKFEEIKGKMTVIL